MLVQQFSELHFSKGLVQTSSESVLFRICHDKVFGMPGEAVKLGAAEFVLPLQKITVKALELVNAE